MNKTQQRQLFSKVTAELQQILQLTGGNTRKSRITKRLSHILDIVSQSGMSSKRKAKLIDQISQINKRLQVSPAKTTSDKNTISTKKTKRYESSAKEERERRIEDRAKSSYKRFLDFNPDNIATIDNDISPSKNQHEIRSLKIRNEILEEQVRLLKSRIKRIRDSSMDQDTGKTTIAMLESELKESYRQQQALAHRVAELTRQLAQKESKIQQLHYNNQKLSKLLRVKQDQMKDNKRKHQIQQRQLEDRLDRNNKHEVPGRKFQLARESVNRGSEYTKLKGLISKYKTFIR